MIGSGLISPGPSGLLGLMGQCTPLLLHWCQTGIPFTNPPSSYVNISDYYEYGIKINTFYGRQLMCQYSSHFFYY